MYYSAVIYPDGNRCEICPDLRSHGLQSTHKLERHEGAFAQLWWDGTRGLIELTESLSYHPPRQAFVLNKCSHTYGVLIERDYPVVFGGL